MNKLLSIVIVASLLAVVPTFADDNRKIAMGGLLSASGGGVPQAEMVHVIGCRPDTSTITVEVLDQDYGGKTAYAVQLRIGDIFSLSGSDEVLKFVNLDESTCDSEFVVTHH